MDMKSSSLSQEDTAIQNKWGMEWISWVATG